MWYPVVVMALLCPLGAGIGSVVLLWLGVVDRVALGSAFAGSFVGLGSIVVVSWFMWLFGRGEDSDEDPLDDADTTDFVALSVLLGPSGLALVATVLIGLNAGG